MKFELDLSDVQIEVGNYRFHFCSTPSVSYSNSLHSQVVIKQAYQTGSPRGGYVMWRPRPPHLSKGRKRHDPAIKFDTHVIRANS